MSRPKPDRGLVGAFANAFDGLRYAIRTQRTFRIHLIIAAVIAVLVFALDLDAVDAAVVVMAMALVIAAELFNTGIEAVVDLLVQQNHHSAAQIAKDISAGSVLTTTVAAAIVGSLVLGPPLVRTVGLGPETAVMLSRWAAAALLIAGAVGLVRLLRRSRRGPLPHASYSSGNHPV
ncbi:MAG TPA: diacylglycerol kinase [bacterium]|jgi:undecaprenol kinase/diacylglycerol kinase (ATP)|nr:diacylglycerol kinase [bacterium]